MAECLNLDTVIAVTVVLYGLAIACFIGMVVVGVRKYPGTWTGGRIPEPPPLPDHLKHHG